MSLAVKIVSLLLTLSIFLFAALHVAYLVAAFDLREQLLQKASTGDIEDSSYQKFLWWLLYLFGETAQRPSDRTAQPSDSGPDPLYSSEIRLWKLTGLICAYVVAVGVNVGLTVALFASSENNRRCPRSSALFIPWLVITLVAVLGLFSLAAAIVIVHFAYTGTLKPDSESKKWPDSGSTASATSEILSISLIPFCAGAVLLAFWVAVARVYIERLRRSFEMEHRLRSAEGAAARDRTDFKDIVDPLLAAKGVHQAEFTTEQSFAGVPVIVQHREEQRRSVERITLYNGLCCRIGWRKRLWRQVLCLRKSNVGRNSKRSHKRGTGTGTITQENGMSSRSSEDYNSSFKGAQNGGEVPCNNSRSPFLPEMRHRPQRRHKRPAIWRGSMLNCASGSGRSRSLPGRGRLKLLDLMRHGVKEEAAVRGEGPNVINGGGQPFQQLFMPSPIVQVPDDQFVNLDLRVPPLLKPSKSCSGIVDAHMESAPANIVDEWSEYDNNGDLQKTKDEAERAFEAALASFAAFDLSTAATLEPWPIRPQQQHFRPAMKRSKSEWDGCSHRSAPGTIRRSVRFYDHPTVQNEDELLI